MILAQDLKSHAYFHLRCQQRIVDDPRKVCRHPPVFVDDCRQLEKRHESTALVGFRRLNPINKERVSTGVNSPIVDTPQTHKPTEYKG